MTPSVLAVCLTNVMIFLVLLRLLPVIWKLRSALFITARSLTQWAEEAEAALSLAPTELEKLRCSLATSRQSLTQIQQRLQFWRGLIGIGRWILAR